LKVALVAAGQMMLVCALLGLILVTLGYGPWQRWLPPLVIMTVGSGVLAYVRGRKQALRR
jgi:hypothetical protein